MSTALLFAGKRHDADDVMSFILGTWLVLAWRVEGWRGLARWLLPLLGMPRWPGRLRHGRPDAEEGHARAATGRAA
jgi:hypothetical protein